MARHGRAPPGKNREALLRDLDAQVGRGDLERDDRGSRLDKFALPVVTRQNATRRRRDERPLLFEAADFVLTRGKRRPFGIEFLLLRLTGADACLRRLPLVLETLQIGRGRDSLLRQPGRAILVALDLGEVRLQLGDLIPP